MVRSASLIASWPFSASPTTHIADFLKAPADALAE
jgi:hypothetical protein